MDHPPPIDPAQITGIILAGGRNSRMGGQHKALLQWRGRSFIAHIVERLSPQVGTLAINSNRDDLFTGLTLPIIADPFDDQRGPLAGMLAGLRYSNTPLVLLVPCDNPRIHDGLAGRLLSALHADDADIAYAVTRSGEHYLYALLRARLADHLGDYLQNDGRAVRSWYSQLRCSRVDFDDHADCFININSADDLPQLD